MSEKDTQCPNCGSKQVVGSPPFGADYHCENCFYLFAEKEATDDISKLE
jgi:rubredoxin